MVRGSSGPAGAGRSRDLRAGPGRASQGGSAGEMLPVGRPGSGRLRGGRVCPRDESPAPRTVGADGWVGAGAAFSSLGPPRLYLTSASRGSRRAPPPFLWTSDLDCGVGISSPPLPSSGPGLQWCPGAGEPGAGGDGIHVT